MYKDQQQYLGVVLRADVVLAGDKTPFMSMYEM